MKHGPGPSHLSTADEPSASLRQAMDKLEIHLPETALCKLDAYCQLLWDWNTKLNLTRHTNYDLFARRDVLDVVRLASHLSAEEEILDVGTGGGVPGLLLAIIRPDLNVSVCDSVAKKTRVLSDIVRRLELPVAVHATRVQDVLEDLRFQCLVARAVGSLSKLLSWLEGHWISFDRLLAIKGPRWVDERKAARHRGLLANLELRRLSSYTMPGTDSESVILQICPKQSSRF